MAASQKYSFTIILTYDHIAAKYYVGLDVNIIAYCIVVTEPRLHDSSISYVHVYYDTDIYSMAC